MTNPPPHTERDLPLQEKGPQDSPVKRVALAPGLHIVATPIGNPRDITLRALDTLAACDRLLCEDTRRTGKLLAEWSITAKLEAYHDHNTDRMIPRALDWLAAGEALALVSDAGTPLVSDPGFKLVRAAHAAGHAVTPVPGVSAAVAALSVAGLPSDRFTFAGFLPPKSAARRRALGDLATAPGTLIVFETGPRLKDCLTDMREVLGDRDAVIARELTKTYEDLRRGPLSTLIPSHPPKGEIVILLAPAAQTVWDSAAIDAALRERADLRAKDAAREVADLSGWSRRDVYNRLQSRK